MLQRCGKGADGSHAFERITDGQCIPIGIIDPIRRVKECISSILMDVLDVLDVLATPSIGGREAEQTEQKFNSCKLNGSGGDCA